MLRGRCGTGSGNKKHMIVILLQGKEENRKTPYVHAQQA